MNTDGRVMGWLMDTVSMAHGDAHHRVGHRQAARDRGHRRARGGTAAGVLMCMRDVFDELGCRSPGGVR